MRSWWFDSTQTSLFGRKGREDLFLTILILSSDWPLLSILLCRPLEHLSILGPPSLLAPLRPSMFPTFFTLLPYSSGDESWVVDSFRFRFATLGQTFPQLLRENWGFFLKRCVHKEVLRNPWSAVMIDRFRDSEVTSTTREDFYLRLFLLLRGRECLYEVSAAGSLLSIWTSVFEDIVLL